MVAQEVLDQARDDGEDRGDQDCLHHAVVVKLRDFPPLLWRQEMELALAGLQHLAFDHVRLPFFHRLQVSGVGRLQVREQELNRLRDPRVQLCLRTGGVKRLIQLLL